MADTEGAVLIADGGLSVGNWISRLTEIPGSQLVFVVLSVVIGVVARSSSSD